MRSQVICFVFWKWCKNWIRWRMNNGNFSTHKYIHRSFIVWATLINERLILVLNFIRLLVFLVTIHGSFLSLSFFFTSIQFSFHERSARFVVLFGWFAFLHWNFISSFSFVANHKVSCICNSIRQFNSIGNSESDSVNGILSFKCKRERHAACEQNKNRNATKEWEMNGKKRREEKPNAHHGHIKIYSRYCATNTRAYTMANANSLYTLAINLINFPFWA